MEEKEKQLRAEVDRLLALAEETDAAEDALYGKGNRGDDLTGEMARTEGRLKKIAEAKTALEQEARGRAGAAKKAAESKLEDRLRRTGSRQEVGRAAPSGTGPGTGPAGASGATQLHRSGKADHAGRRTQRLHAGLQCADRSGQRHNRSLWPPRLLRISNDKKQLAPMLERVAQNMGTKLVAATADTGYFSESQITDERVIGIELYVAIGKQKHGREPHAVPETGDLTVPPANPVRPKKMRQKLQTDAGRDLYKMRESDCGAGVRPDQGRARYPGLSVTRHRENRRGMEADPPHNLLKLFPVRISASDGLKA